MTTTSFFRGKGTPSNLNSVAIRWSRRLLLPLAFAGLLPLSRVADAGVVSSSDCLPPLDPNDAYVGVVHARFATGLGLVDLTDFNHRDFSTCLSPPASGSQLHTFSSTAEFDASFGGGPFTHFTAPAAVQVQVTFDHQTGNTRFFDTEMLQLDISGGTLPAAVIIRESPTLASTGETTIENVGSGSFVIDSFFDVFIELSLDGGQTFTPCDPCGRVTLQRIPEPSSLLLLAAAGVALWSRRRCSGSSPSRPRR
jgi:hypothetical protein